MDRKMKALRAENTQGSGHNSTPVGLNPTTRQRQQQRKRPDGADARLRHLKRLTHGRVTIPALQLVLIQIAPGHCCVCGRRIISGRLFTWETGPTSYRAALCGRHRDLVHLPEAEQVAWLARLEMEMACCLVEDRGHVVDFRADLSVFFGGGTA